MIYTIQFVDKVLMNFTVDEDKKVLIDLTMFDKIRLSLLKQLLLTNKITVLNNDGARNSVTSGLFLKNIDSLI